ncbi:hypothetical protein [Streptacidiphilus rugosus]|uniref:hypothetical protein n=1 Tax=Streptacidiphilus rugosus TaxID=405783 RepID=UPI00055F70AD|nr:hypothetical protein [Streptacidiphilus rugosus]
MTSRSLTKTAARSATRGTIASTSSRVVRSRSSVVPILALASKSTRSRSRVRAARRSAWKRAVTSTMVELTPSTRPLGSWSRK